MLMTFTNSMLASGVLRCKQFVSKSGHRSRNYKTPMLPEFKQGSEEFARRDDDEPTPRKPPTPVLQIVPDDGANDDGGSESSERQIKNGSANEGF